MSNDNQSDNIQIAVRLTASAKEDMVTVVVHTLDGSAMTFNNVRQALLKMLRDARHQSKQVG